MPDLHVLSEMKDMKQYITVLALLSLGLGCTSRTPVPQSKTFGTSSHTQIEERIFIPAEAGKSAQLCIVVTSKGKLHAWQDIVLSHAEEALAVLSDHHAEDATVGFFVRSSKESHMAAASGFSATQLREFIALPEDEAKSMISKHAWSLLKIPKRRQNKNLDHIPEVQ